MSNIWITDKCPECGQSFKYLADQIYKPHTCANWECQHKFTQRLNYLELIHEIDQARRKAFAEK